MAYKLEKSKLALILGSGFSCESGLPSTAEMVHSFLDNESDSAPLEEARITKILREFWRDVFGYTNGGSKPSLEDHFTVLDLSTNTGHYLGPKYPPKKLRAIRRMSIHRIFYILDKKYKPSDSIKKLLRELNNCFKVSIVSLNWDIVVEKHLRDLKIPFHYGLKVFHRNGQEIEVEDKSISLLKMHSSSNWEYCDSCRRIYVALDKKSAYYSKAYLEAEDFHLFGINDLGIDKRTPCHYCGNKLAGRLITFSFRKAFSIPQFQAIWEQAHTILSETDKWLFIGYSIPEADFEFRHLLKSAQLARTCPASWSSHVILKENHNAENRAKDRYESFFGVNGKDISQNGLESWVKSSLDEYIRRTN